MNWIVGLMLAGLLALSVIIGGVATTRSTAPPPAPTPTAGFTPAASDLGPLAAALNAATRGAAATAGPSVVKVESAQGLGSGVIIDSRGYIVTNYHVLSGANGIRGTDTAYAVTLA